MRQVFSFKMIVWIRDDRHQIWRRYKICTNWLESFRTRNELSSRGILERNILVRRGDQDEPR